MIKNNFDGYTLVEMITTLVIASAFSVGLYFIFISSTNNINREEVLFDIKNYTTNSLEIISEKIRSADQIEINSILGSTMITITNTISSEQEEQFVYSVIDNMIYENSQAMKIPGYQWLLNDQEMYDFTLTMNCLTENLTFSESIDEGLRESTYDLTINVNIESKIDEDYETSYKASNRIFAINKFSQLTPSS